MEQYKGFKAGKLTVKIFSTRNEMGAGAAEDVAGRIRQLLAAKDHLNMIFAAAPSQNEFLDALSGQEGVDWKRINAFHMDEYVGLEELHPQRFSNFLKERIFEKVAFRKVYLLSANGQTPETSCEKYAELLRRFPPDIVCMGIGENTHVAFNDPHVADFNDPLLVKPVLLDEASRLQQVHDGCFSTLSDVPERAVTLTVPALLKAGYIFCMVPGANKALAVYHTVNDHISEQYPSTSLREHPDAVLYLDRDSASKLDNEEIQDV